MRRRSGFTLIELLVVIAMIALLMSILMPALQRVQRQTRGVGCKSNLHQWGLIFAMYTGDTTPIMTTNQHEMQRMCVNRHGGAQYCLFADGSVRTGRSSRQLWKLKWHRSFDINAAGPVWPKWMAGFRDEY